MRGAFFFAAILALLAIGFRMPIVMFLGYIWVDIVKPQNIAWGALSYIPTSLLFGGLTAWFAFTRLSSRRQPPTTLGALTLIMVIWMTITLLWAEVPEPALAKWSWAYKTMLLLVFVHPLITSRRDVAAIMWALIISLMYHVLPIATKTMVGGGAYGVQMTIAGVNSGFAESSTVALAAVCMIPMFLFLASEDTLLIERDSRRRLVCWGGCIVCIVCAIGTHARTGLVALVVCAAGLILFSRRKILYSFVAIAAGWLILYFAGEQWQARMHTIDDGNEESAMGRVAVWRWTWEYVLAHPWGGSFDVYRIGEYSHTLANGRVLAVKAKAFHSVWFELLGELGFLGFGLYLVIILVVLTLLMRLIRLGTLGADRWYSNLGRMMLVSVVVHLVGGSFVGIAFQPLFWYMTMIIGVSWRLLEQEVVQRRAGVPHANLAGAARSRNSSGLAMPLVAPGDGRRDIP